MLKHQTRRGKIENNNLRETIFKMSGICFN